MMMMIVIYTTESLNLFAAEGSWVGAVVMTAAGYLPLPSLAGDGISLPTASTYKRLAMTLTFQNTNKKKAFKYDGYKPSFFFSWLTENYV